MLIAAGLSVVMLASAAGCGKRERMEAEINPDTPVSEVLQISLQTKRTWLWHSLETFRMVCSMQE